MFVSFSFFLWTGVENYIKVPKIISQLCALCQGTSRSQCSTSTSMNKYASYHGSFKCMAENGGDVAFVKHTTVEEVVAQGGYGTVSDYQYLCKDNSRKGKQETVWCTVFCKSLRSMWNSFSRKYLAVCEWYFYTRWYLWLMRLVFERAVTNHAWNKRGIIDLIGYLTKHCRGDPVRIVWG